MRIILEEKSEGAGVATQVFQDDVRQQLSDGESRYKLVPIFLNGLAAPIGTDPKPIDLIVRRPNDESDTWGEALLDFRVLPNANGCGEVIFSVWDFDMRVALDAFLVSLPIASRLTAPSDCRDPMLSDRTLSGPNILSISDAFKAGARQTTASPGNRISIYAFQLPVAGGDSYAFAVLAPKDGQVSVHGWKLESSLSKAFGEDASSFNSKAAEDRTRMKSANYQSWIYKETAWYIRESLFRGVDVGNESDAQEAFTEITNFVNTKESVSIAAQLYVPKSNEEQGMMFLPLRTMAGANSEFFRSDFNQVNPLPGVEQDTTDCIADWHVILDGDMASSPVFNSLRDLKPTRWRTATLHKNEDILAFFDPESVSSNLKASALVRSFRPGGTGLIIAAHYGGGKLGLNGEYVLPVNRIKRPFPESSAAILAACETAAPAAASGIISRLRANQVTSYLASPIKVPTPYAVSMVSYLTKRIDAAYEKGETPTLRELYVEAMNDVGKEDPTNFELNNLGREYVMVGNSDIRLCKLPSEETAP